MILDQLPTLTQSLLNRISQRMYTLVRVYHHDPIELAVSPLCTLYGLFLLMPWDTYGSSKAFNVLAGWLPEWTAGLLFLVIGGRWFIGVMLEQRFPRRLNSFFAFALYTLWAVMIGVANLPGLGWLIYGGMAMLCLWACYRNCSRA